MYSKDYLFLSLFESFERYLSYFFGWRKKKNSISCQKQLLDPLEVETGYNAIKYRESRDLWSTLSLLLFSLSVTIKKYLLHVSSIGKVRVQKF